MICMQIFRPYKEHNKSAMWLDDARLNKQVLEALQVCNACLRDMGIIPKNGKRIYWIHHPITRAIYNEGKPYLPDLLRYAGCCLDEWYRRGFKGHRMGEFYKEVLKIVNDNIDGFDSGEMRRIFVGENTVMDTDDIYDMYKEYLYGKWSRDKIKVKVTLWKFDYDWLK